MTHTMRAAVSSAEGLVLREVAIPEPGSEQILVKVAAAGMNRADLNAARGAGVARPEDLGRPIGMEWSGEVVAAGQGADRFRPGDRVACSGTGGYAEYALCDMGRALPIAPGTLDLRTAAGYPLVLMTAHNALTLAAFRPGDRLFVHGASSAVGIAAVRIARLLGAGTIGVSSRSPQKREALNGYGADVAVSPEPGWADAWRDACGGADVLIDMIAGPAFDETLSAMALLGRLVLVGRLAGTRADFDLDRIMLKRLSVIGATFRTRSVAEVRAIVDGVAAQVWPHVLSGALTLPVDRTFALAEAPQAHARMARDGHFGKILLVP